MPTRPYRLFFYFGSVTDAARAVEYALDKESRPLFSGATVTFAIDRDSPSSWDNWIRRVVVPVVPRTWKFNQQAPEEGVKAVDLIRSLRGRVGTQVNGTENKAAAEEMAASLKGGDDQHGNLQDEVKVSQEESEPQLDNDAAVMGDEEGREDGIEDINEDDVSVPEDAFTVIEDDVDDENAGLETEGEAEEVEEDIELVGSKELHDGDNAQSTDNK